MCRKSLVLFLMAAAAAGRAGFAAGTLELISQVAPSQVSGTGAGTSFNRPYSLVFTPPSLSNDGRYVVFQSYETNLVSGERDLNQNLDLYVEDLLTGTTSLVSHTADSPVTTANQPSYQGVISGDGRWIAFTSRATDIVPGLPPKPVEPPSSSGAIYLYERATGVITLVTNAPPHAFYGLALSGDGRYLAFGSRARRLVPGQQGAGDNVFLYDREARSFRLVSHTASPTAGGGNSSRYPVFSTDGRWLAFLSFADLAPGKPAGDTAYLYDMASGEITAAGFSGFMALSADGRYLAVHGVRGAYLYDRVTRTATPLAKGRENFDDSAPLAISADGRWIALSAAPERVIPPQPGSLALGMALYLYDRASGTFTLVSRKLGAAGAPGAGREPSFSADGRLLLFSSPELDLVPGQVNPGKDVTSLFLYDRSSGTTSLVTHTSTPTTAPSINFSYDGILSADGSRAVFYSGADNLGIGTVDGNGAGDAFVYTTATASLAAVSHPPAGEPSITPEATSGANAVSADGRWVVFGSTAVHLIAGQSSPYERPNVFLRDRATRTTTLVSHAAGSLTRTANGSSGALAATPDSRWILFTSDATDLIAGTTFSGKESNDFLYDRLTGAVVFVGPTHLASSSFPNPDPQGDITPDGRWVVFTRSQAPIVSGHLQQDRDVYLWDRLTRTSTLVSHTAAGPTAISGVTSYAPQISDDGRWVAFVSLADDLVPGAADGNGLPDLFLWDRTTGKTVLVSHAKGSPGVAGSLQRDQYATRRDFTMSADGRFIAFESSDEIAGIEHGVKGGLYLYDRTTAGLVRISDRGELPLISADGQSVAFSLLTKPDEQEQVFVYDRRTGTTTLVSRSISGDPGGAAGFSDGIAISADGRYVAFQSTATDLVPGQPQIAPGDYWTGLFLADRLAGTIGWVTAPGPATVNSPNVFLSSSPACMSASGRQLAFSTQQDLLAGDGNNQEDAYLFSLDPPPVPTTGLVTIPPCALFDGAGLRSNVRRPLKAAGRCGVPATATQVLVKVTALDATGAGNLRLYPGDVPDLAAGILPFDRGQTAEDSFLLPLATNGRGTLALLPFVRGNGMVRVMVEVGGYVP